jgi:NAD(P)-dependent dehydrogenase (short-subunit alcohol dehydrogenase family)
MKLKDKRVAIIGGSSGIGFGVARAAVDAGATVMIGSSDASKVDSACVQLGGAATGITVNVRDEASVESFFDTIGKFDHLVFTAGDWGSFRKPSSTADIDLTEAGAVFEVRFWGALSATKHALKQISHDGSITLTNGVVAHRPRKGAPLSTAMAGALEHLTQALAVDLAPLRVNVVCPGLVLTDVWNSIPEDKREEQLQAMTADQPLPRAGTPEELAEAYLYLMCGSFSTGQVLVVDGGKTLV